MEEKGERGAKFHTCKTSLSSGKDASNSFVTAEEHVEESGLARQRVARRLQTEHSWILGYNRGCQSLPTSPSLRNRLCKLFQVKETLSRRVGAELAFGTFHRHVGKS